VFKISVSPTSIPRVARLHVTRQTILVWRAQRYPASLP
jgi:hypothetical protein